MDYIRRFFDATSDNGGGNAANDSSTTAAVVDPTKVDQVIQDSPKLPEPAFTLEELKTFGFDSKEAFVAHLQKVKEDNKPDEEKQRQANIEKATFLKFAAEENLINDDFNKYESLSAKAARDLVFEKYVADWKEENPDIKDESEIAAQVKEDFENEYKLNSENEKAKARGLAKIEREAKSLKAPSENAWNTAKSHYEEFKKVNNEGKVFDNLVDGILKEVPEKLALKLKDGEQEIDFDVELTKEQKAELEKTFKNKNVFGNWYTSTPEERAEFKAKLSKKIEGFVKINTFDSAIQGALTKGIGIGTAKGSTTGAANSFHLTQGANRVETPVISLEESNKKMAEARQRARNNR